MFKNLIIALASMLLLSTSSNAQKNKKDIAEQKLTYKRARILIESATMERKAGHILIADSLINKSIETYPTLEIYTYAKQLMEESDIKGANQIIDKTFQRVKNFESDRVCMEVQLYGLIDMRKKTALHEHATYALEVNIPFGNLESIRNSYEVYMNNLVSFKLPLFSLNVKAALGDEAYFKPRIVKQFAYKMDYFMLNEKYEEGLKYIADKPEGNYIKKDSYNPWKVEFYMKLKNDQKTLEAIKDLNKQTEAYYTNLYKLKKGDTISPLPFFQELYKASSITGNSKMVYNQAKIDLYFHRYETAISKLKTALTQRGKPTFFGYVSEEYKWNIYTALGDAYTALGQFDKARDAYNIALLAYPNYDPTIQSIAALNKRISETKITDKTAPVITLLEPTPKRGLKVTTVSPNVLIKGTAIDISGIQEVQINDKTAYTQSSGDFWAEIPLKEGINKVSISATDLAGNNANQIFNIERLVAKNNPTENDETIIPVSEKKGNNICLLISAQNYSDLNIPSLSNPIADAIKLKIVLKNDYNFTDGNIFTLFNPTKNEIKQQLLELVSRLQPEDNLIIFYAGHGIWVEKEKKGYWLMTDAKRNDINTWVSNKEVLDLIAKIPSRHTLLITDACFSGSVFKTRGLSGAAPKAIQEMNEKISRIAITSGNDTEVPDESVFMKYLIKALSENKDKYLTAQKMFITQIIEAVMTESKTEPRYGTLELAGHVGGDFIFTKK